MCLLLLRRRRGRNVTVGMHGGFRHEACLVFVCLGELNPTKQSTWCFDEIAEPFSSENVCLQRRLPFEVF